VTYWLLPWTLPLYIQGHIMALLTFGWAWWGKPRYIQGILQTPWRKGFRWGDHWVTTIATWMGAKPGRFPEPGSRLWHHEVKSHAWRYEDHCLKASIISGIGLGVATDLWAFWLVLWLTAGPLWEAPGYLSALARYWKAGRAAGRPLWKIAYRGHGLERHGYAEDDHFNKLPWEVT